ncbi:hypothetical protein Poli38472_002422 [Pythium oligandrum]|uniref:Uncharacterized protein n=1 Tax=Pythium oligandrum TaxID=41045 RepID=A0A8K1FI65_PYTOL|nr:hypothetical protein Poli38472_002422 [Pythium oligandrum]|eukprot:TMW63481.1 hypothetical protein Poli38472_002422 [Pythium oligandrum]
MRLNIHVHGLQFVVPCGDGSQSFKWLGLVVAQRYALAVPHGRVRTREDAHLKPGFFLPASITKTQSGQVLPPTKKITELCKDNESITVQLQQELPVNEIGAPQFSSWSVSAFSTPPKVSGSAVAELSLPPSEAKAGTPASSARSDAKTSTSRAPPAEKKGDDDEIKDYARLEMLQQVNSGQLQSEMEVEAAFLYDWARLHVEELEKDSKERDALQELLLGYFAQVNTAYMHYAVGSGEMAYGMNGHELAHFLHECGLYHFQQDHAAIEKLYSLCLRHDSLLSLHDRSTLGRAGFFHALLRAMLYTPKDATNGTSKEIIEKRLKEQVLPTVLRLTSGPFRDHTHQNRIIAIFQEVKPKLIKLYEKYTQDNDEKALRAKSVAAASPGWPILLTASGLKSMLYDCGVFCAGDTKKHDEIFGKAIEQCFTGMRELRITEDQPLVFAEYVEVVTRVGLTVLEENGLAPKDAIKITLNALRSLPIKTLNAHRK